MSKRTIGILYIVSIIMGLVGTGLILGGVFINYTANNVYSTNGQVTGIGNVPLFATGVVIVSLAGILYLIAWIGALVNLARLQQWVWFILMFFFHGIALLIYVIAGPTTPPGVPQYAQQYMPPQYYPQPPPGYPPGYPQPPQGYPQQPQSYPQPKQEHPQQ